MDEKESNMDTDSNVISGKIHYDDSLTSGKGTTDDILLSGLSENSSETSRLAAAFWEMVWPKLEEGGWQKLVRTSEDSKAPSVILATKKDLDIGQSEQGKDYYVRIKDVLDRINSRRNNTEALLADRFHRAISKPSFQWSYKPTEKRLDLSWKDGGKHFPRKSSRVGEDYQVSSIPKADKYSVTDNRINRTFYELIWDPAEARQKGITLMQGNDDLANFPHNIREAAFLELARQRYSLEALQSEFVPSLKPSDGSDWSEAQKEKFHGYIFRFRRNLQAVAKAMNLPMKVCHAYYLGSYKSTPDYLLLKAVCTDEKSGKSSNSRQSFDVCCICDDGGSLIICDGCEGEYHMKCLQPPLRSVPEGHWLCDECVDRNFFHARDVLFRKSRFFAKVETPNEVHTRKRSLEELPVGSMVETNTNTTAPEITITSSKTAYTPSVEFVDAVGKWSYKMQRILSREKDQIIT